MVDSTTPNKNFLHWKIEKIAGELYIGKGAGNVIREEVNAAKESIKVCSPYISEDYLSSLLDKADNSCDPKIELECITQSIHSNSPTYTKDNFGLSNTYKRILKQHQHINTEKQKQKEHLFSQYERHKKLSLSVLVLSFIYPFIGTLLFQKLYAITFSKSHTVPFFILEIHFFIFIVLLVLSILFYRHAKICKAHSQAIIPVEYSYSFTKNFRLISRDSNFPFPHLKLLIIDKKKAYLGSLNFTVSGFYKNLETCICITNSQTINELCDYFTSLYSASKESALSADSLGSYYFDET